MKIPEKVLVVCYGNICRSPVAEYILKKYAKESEILAINSMEIKSAGLHPVLQEMSHNSLRYLETHDIGENLSLFESTPISKSLVQKYDTILVLENYMKEEILAICRVPRDEEEVLQWSQKMHTLSEAANLHGDIEDPYGMNYARYEKILSQIKKLCKLAIKNWEKYYLIEE